jgi:DNA polymerase elongation subunit (family B)
MVIDVIIRVDPDLMVAFDQERKGIRYLAERGIRYGINLSRLISRCC